MTTKPTDSTRSEPLQRRAEAGAANLAAFLASEKAEPLSDLRDDVATWQARLLTDLGDDVSASRFALAASAAASYLVVLLATEKLLRLRRWRRSTDAIVDLLGREQGNLARALRDLGVSPKDVTSDADPPSRGGLAEYLASKATESDGNGHS